jgi:mono/diheme cytochrome c family protein
VNKTLAWFLGIIAVLIGLVVIFSVFVYFNSQSRFTRIYDVDIQAVEVPNSPEAVERGQYLVTTIAGCVDCHGANYAGDVFIDDAMIGRFFGANLTSGNGGIGQDYTDLDWVRSIRHGIKPDGSPILVMPAMDYYNLSDADLGAIIAYIKSLPPVDNMVEPSSAGPVGRALAVTGQINMLSAEIIDHDQPHPGAPERAQTPDYGKYLASIGCVGCHGAELAGGPIAGTPPDWPPASNLTPGGDLATWDEADFMQTLRSGMTPSGKILNAEYMPWPNLILMTDEDLGALWAYLQTLPAR